MASFDTAYNTYIKPNEGGYANVVGDKGGETYAGIARNYFPNWKGWVSIDYWKKLHGEPKRNQMFPEINYLVEAFYKDWWNAKRFGEINSQEIANLLFDYNVNSGVTAIKAVQRLAGVTADGAIGPQTIAAINKADAATLFNALKEDRRKLFESLAKKPGQSQFYEGWMARLSRFNDMVTPTNTGIAVLIVAVLGTIFFLTTDSKKVSV
jgi:lysozyme family protein